jgi:hypothetical protein
MRFRFALLLTLFSANAFAVGPQFWRVRTADDFLAGDIDGFAVTSRRRRMAIDFSERATTGNSTGFAVQI